jgi:hypothetical protein
MINEEEIEELMRTAFKIKRTFTFNKSSISWQWHEYNGETHRGFKSFYQALKDSVESYEKLGAELCDEEDLCLNDE